MATLPTIESILLEINQSIGGPSFTTDKKQKFSNRRMQWSKYQEMYNDILQNIMNKLRLDKEGKSDFNQNIDDASSFFKLIELNTWTGSATKQQITWLWLAYVGVPGIARHMAFWNHEHVTDKGMSGGIFWYLPEIIERKGKPMLHLPVAQIVDWLLDLLGIPMHKFAEEYRAKADFYDVKTTKLIRTLYNWQASENVPQPNKFLEFFPDSLTLDFKGCFTIKHGISHSEQFCLALQFIKQKFSGVENEKIAEILSHEIPITQVEILESILNQNSDNKIEQRFIELLAIRYAKPEPDIIRHYFLMARIAQDGYIRLLKFLFPNVDKLCIDPSKNKLLQLISIYKFVYNLSIESFKNNACHNTADQYFENEIPFYLDEILISICPSKGKSAYKLVSEILTNKFIKSSAEDELEDVHPYNEVSMQNIFSKNMNEFRDKLETIDNSEKLKKLFPFTTPQEFSILMKKETKFDVVYHFLHIAHLQPKQRLITLDKLSVLAQTPHEKMITILLKLNDYFDNNLIQPDDVSLQVENLIKEAEENSEYIAWQAPVLKYKAKHALALNDFNQAKKLFREALNCCINYNYAAFRSEVAYDLLAIEVATSKFIPQNHSRYYQEIINFGMPEIGAMTLDYCVKQCKEHFEKTLYKPYAKS